MPTSAEPRWRRLEPDERRDQILAAAVRAFGERPYAEVWIAEIAREAGVARGLVNHYFGTKRDLYLESLKSLLFVPPLAAPVEVGGSRRDRIEYVVGWVMNVVERHGQSWLAAAAAGGTTADPEVTALLDEADDLAAQRVLAVIGFEGSAEQQAVAHAAVRSFGGLAKAMSRELIERRTLTSEQVRHFLTVALDAILTDLA